MDLASVIIGCELVLLLIAIAAVRAGKANGGGTARRPHPRRLKSRFAKE